jgi:hypothetical protein
MRYELPALQGPMCDAGQTVSNWLGNFAASGQVAKPGGLQK